MVLLVMISVSPNSSWVERTYSYLDRVCEKRRNRLKVENLDNLFMLDVLTSASERMPQLQQCYHCWDQKSRNKISLYKFFRNKT